MDAFDLFGTDSSANRTHRPSLIDDIEASSTPWSNNRSHYRNTTDSDLLLTISELVDVESSFVARDSQKNKTYDAGACGEVIPDMKQLYGMLQN